MAETYDRSIFRYWCKSHEWQAKYLLWEVRYNSSILSHFSYLWIVIYKAITLAHKTIVTHSYGWKFWKEMYDYYIKGLKREFECVWIFKQKCVIKNLLQKFDSKFREFLKRYICVTALLQTYAYITYSYEWVIEKTPNADWLTWLPKCPCASIGKAPLFATFMVKPALRLISCTH